jgi:double-stranded RNA-binding protein Staufen
MFLHFFSIINFFVPEYGQSINPISRLIQIQQAKKEKEPIYTLIAEKGMPRRREFVMQVKR